jgi:hypothetical protein
MNTKVKLAALAVAALVAVAGLAEAQVVTGITGIKPPPLKPMVNSTAITGVSTTGTCGANLSVSVTIKGGTLGGEGVVVVGTASRFTAAYKVGPNATLTVTVPTTNKVTCGSPAALPGGSAWLEPTMGGSDASMWVFTPTTVTFKATHQPVPG